MGIAARLDDYGKPAWIALMVLGFILCWPVGLAMLAFLIGSGRMACWKHGGQGWHHDGMDRMEDTMGRWRERWQGRGRRHGWGRRDDAPSGNRAFDEYRAETLRRLEEEQREFRDFLERLRFAKDKAEFDEFLAERRRRSETPEPPPAP
jgi:hypothetical protein